MDSARGRIGRRDVVITVLVSLLGVHAMVETLWGEPIGERGGPDADFVAITWRGILPLEASLGLILLVTVPLLWRRAAPIPAVGAALVGTALNVLLIGTEPIRCGTLLPVAFLFAFTAGAQLDGRQSRTGLALSVGLLLVGVPLELGVGWTVIPAALAIAVWGIGRIVHSRVRLSDELQTRTAELHEARDDRARLEVAADRARLSRELDELLQRRLRELGRMADDRPHGSDVAGATATLADIERESRRTLEEMRAVVGVLRDDASEAPTAPQPTLTHLEALLVRAKGRGAQFSAEGSPRVLPAGVELSAYRIVEHLLDALEDAPGVGVRVRFGDDALELAVSGPARRRAKASIERARERVQLQHGTLDATVRGGRAEAVVSLPVVSVV